MTQSWEVPSLFTRARRSGRIWVDSPKTQSPSATPHRTIAVETKTNGRENSPPRYGHTWRLGHRDSVIVRRLRSEGDTISSLQHVPRKTGETSSSVNLEPRQLHAIKSSGRELTERGRAAELWRLMARDSFRFVRKLSDTSPAPPRIWDRHSSPWKRKLVERRRRAVGNGATPYAFSPTTCRSTHIRITLSTTKHGKDGSTPARSVKGRGRPLTVHTWWSVLVANTQVRVDVGKWWKTGIEYAESWKLHKSVFNVANSL